MKTCKEQYQLSAKTVDRISSLLGEILTENGTDKKDIIRIRLSAEEILELWLEHLEGAAVLFKTGERFGRPYLEIRVEGPQRNPSDEEDALLLSSQLMAQAGLALSYSYKNGRNCLTCNPPKKAHFSQITQLVIALLLALCLGGLLRLLPGSVQNAVTAVTGPLFETILGALRAISSPMIFLAVCWGIISIGDLSVVGKIGTRLITRMVSAMFLVGIAFALIASPFLDIHQGAGGTLGNGFSEIYTMVLAIVPSDIISPFLEGNALQIIFLGICVGVAILVLGQRASVVSEFIVQANEVVNFLMRVLGKFVPVFVFLSIFNLLLESSVDYMGIVKIFAIVIPSCLLLCLVYVMIAAVKFRISPLLVIRKLLPTFLIGLSTASSAAAFTTNLETCTRKFGIPKKIANFAVPLGQVIFKPDCVICFFAIAICMAEYYGVEITVMWLVTAVLTTGLLAMATPPVPGGTLSVFTIMFVQLGIPGEAIALSVAVNSILDFVLTAVGLTCMLAEILLTAGDLQLLDEKKLRK